MAYYIIIRGPLGSGKTTLSEQLASVLDAKHFQMDEVLKTHGLDIIPPDAPCISVEKFLQANEIVLPEVRELLANDKIVIFDACFYHKEVIEHLIQNLPSEHYIFTLKAPLALCVQRDSHRSKTHGEDAAAAVHSLVTRFDIGITIDVAGSIESALEQIISVLPKSKTHIA